MAKEIKRYIIRKYVMASSLNQAIKLDKTTPVGECWIDSDYKEEEKQLTPAIGFSLPQEED